MEREKLIRKILTITAVTVSAGLLILFNFVFDSYMLRIVNLCGIYITLALSLNLIYGFTGLFSLGHAGFMEVGAYTTALLTMSPAQKEMNFLMEALQKERE